MSIHLKQHFKRKLLKFLKIVQGFFRKRDTSNPVMAAKLNIKRNNAFFLDFGVTYLDTFFNSGILKL